MHAHLKSCRVTIDGRSNLTGKCAECDGSWLCDCKVWCHKAGHIVEAALKQLPAAGHAEGITAANNIDYSAAGQLANGCLQNIDIGIAKLAVHQPAHVTMTG